MIDVGLTNYTLYHLEAKILESCIPVGLIGIGNNISITYFNSNVMS